MAVAPTETYHLLVGESATVTGGLTSAIAPADGAVSFVGDAAVIQRTSGLSLRILDRADMASVLGTPEKADMAPRVTPVLNDAGAGSFTMGLDDPNFATVTFGRLFQLVEDSDVRFTGIIESQTRRRVTKGEEAHELLTVQGRAHVALLEQAVVFPEGGTGVSQFNDTRYFNWANPNYDDSEWVDAQAVARQGTNPNSTSQWAPPYQGQLYPANYSDPDAWWMSPTVGTWEDNPDGDWYLRWDFSVSPAGTYRLEFAADNDCVLFIDGVQIGDGGFGYKETYSIDLELTSGSHVLAARVTNIPKTGNNPSGFIASLWNLDGDDLDTVEARTAPGETIVVLDSPTTSGGSGIAFDITQPGMNPGEVLDLLLTEAQDRGALPGWSWTFTDTSASGEDYTLLESGDFLLLESGDRLVLESDPGPGTWSTVGEIAVKVGDDYLTVLRQLAGTYIDFDTDVDQLVLHAYVAGELGEASGVTYTKGASLTELTAEGEG